MKDKSKGKRQRAKGKNEAEVSPLRDRGLPRPHTKSGLALPSPTDTLLPFALCLLPFDLSFEPPCHP